MKLYSTNDPNNIVDLKEAVFRSLPIDKGLYMPTEVPILPASFFSNIANYSFQEIAIEVCKTLFQGSISDHVIKGIIEKSITFPAPLITLDNNNYVLELFHGPSLAFKDFGARFMAQLMSYFLEKDQKKLTILVATSGDTGGAVASGFYKTEGIEVIILYPSGKVSDLQEKQLTTLGENITAVEIHGTFDDCQSIVKQAFLDQNLNDQYNLSSANSINIARLIPQTFYYFEAYKQLGISDIPTIFCVPSGNFGNLTAGLLAHKMGLPIHKFIAATNLNDIVPEYLSSGKFIPRPSKTTISNAMDVGNPSNFARMLHLYGSTWNMMKEKIVGYRCDDTTTREVMERVYSNQGYVLDPHTAVAYYAAEQFLNQNEPSNIICLGTAHPSKFIDEVENVINDKVKIPERLAILANRKTHSVEMNNSFNDFKEWMKNR